jgi:hypothetical protein
MVASAGPAQTKVHFGGPDQPPRALRDLLEARVDAVPSGGSIDWVTYYFRDEALARSLVRANQRGVSVRLSIDADPRREHANDAVIDILSSTAGIGVGLRTVEHRLPGHLHTKLYAFSHPLPHVLAGSFNPSGNDPEDPDVVAEIGDQDRGHNLLVEIDELQLVERLVAHARTIHAGANRFGTQYLRSWRRARGDGDQAYLFPRPGANPLATRIGRLGRGARLRIAASHFKDARIARRLADLARRGGRVEVLTHHTLRRSPHELVDYLRESGVRTYRYEHPEGLPMHSKFVLAEDDHGRWSAFGSYNLNPTSRWFNQELLIFSGDADLWQTLDERWTQMIAEPWCTE